MSAVDEVSGTISAAQTRPFKEVRKGYTWFTDGDVLFAKITPCMENGKAALAAGLQGGVGFGSTEFHVLRPRDGVLPEWVRYFVRRESFRKEAQRSFTGTGGQQRVPVGFLERVMMPVPPLDEQRRIVDILSRAEGILRLQRGAERKAAELVPAIFLEMFGDPATNPKGWPVKSLPQVLARPFKNGLYLPKNRYVDKDSQRGIEMVHMSDAFYGEVKRGCLRRVIADAALVAVYGLTSADLLVARRSLNFEGAAKVCGIPRSPEPLLFESSFIRLTPDRSQAFTEYLLHYLNHPLTRSAHIVCRISGITISGINQAALSEVPVLCPPLKLQESFVSRVAKVRSVEQLQLEGRDYSEAIVDSLLRRFFRASPLRQAREAGGVRVT